MKFSPEKCTIPDRRMEPFIDPAELLGFLNNTKPTQERVKEIIATSLEKQRLTLEETAALINADNPELV